MHDNDRLQYFFYHVKYQYFVIKMDVVGLKLDK